MRIHANASRRDDPAQISGGPRNQLFDGRFIRRSRWRAAVGLISAAFVIFATASCASSSSRHADVLRNVGGSGNYTSGLLEEVPLNRPYVVYIGNLCTVGAAATITAIRPARPSGSMRVVAWGVRHRVKGDDASVDDPGAVAGKLSDYSGFGVTPVRETCRRGDGDVNSELDVNVLRATSTPAIAHGFFVIYKVGSSSAKLLVPYTLGLCPRSCPDVDTSKVG
jgi:hypothetical protein